MTGPGRPPQHHGAETRSSIAAAAGPQPPAGAPGLAFGRAPATRAGVLRGLAGGARRCYGLRTVFGIGLTEMILVGLVILMLFSPRELPGMMKTVAKVYGSLRRTAEDFRAQVMEADELREPIEEIRAAYHGTKQELLSAQELARRELGRARLEAMKAQQKLAELAREENRRDAQSKPSPLHGRVSASDKLEDDTKPAGSALPAAAPVAAVASPPAGSPPAAATPVAAAPVATTRAPDRSDAA